MRRPWFNSRSGNFCFLALFNVASRIALSNFLSLGSFDPKIGQKNRGLFLYFCPIFHSFRPFLRQSTNNYTFPEWFFSPLANWARAWSPYRPASQLKSYVKHTFVWSCRMHILLVLCWCKRRSPEIYGLTRGATLHTRSRWAKTESKEHTCAMSDTTCQILKR